MKLKLYRKLFLFIFLAIAGLLAGEIYQRYAAKTPAEVLENIRAEKLLTESLTVNGVPMIATLYKLPEYVSGNLLKQKKVRGQYLVLDRFVYIFDGDVSGLRGKCPTPAYEAGVGMTYEYVVESVSGRYILAHSDKSRAELKVGLDNWCKNAGWEPIGENIYRREDLLFIFSLSEGKNGTSIAMAISKGPTK